MIEWLAVEGKCSTCSPESMKKKYGHRPFYTFFLANGGFYSEEGGNQKAKNNALDPFWLPNRPRNMTNPNTKPKKEGKKGKGEPDSAVEMRPRVKQAMLMPQTDGTRKDNHEPETGSRMTVVKK